MTKIPDDIRAKIEEKIKSTPFYLLEPGDAFRNGAGFGYSLKPTKYLCTCAEPMKAGEAQRELLSLLISNSYIQSTANEYVFRHDDLVRLSATLASTPAPIMYYTEEEVRVLAYKFHQEFPEVFDKHFSRVKGKEVTHEDCINIWWNQNKTPQP